MRYDTNALGKENVTSGVWRATLLFSTVHTSGSWPGGWANHQAALAGLGIGSR
jgi:hypothetical protein